MKIPRGLFEPPQAPTKEPCKNLEQVTYCVFYNHENCKRNCYYALELERKLNYFGVNRRNL